MRPLTLLIVLGACGSPPASPTNTSTTTTATTTTPPANTTTPPTTTMRSTKPMTVQPAMFGDIAIEDGAIHLTDGGIHGVQGHTIVVPPTGATLTWERRLDSVGPSGKPGRGTLDASPDELAKLRQWADAVWALAPKGKASFTDRSGGVPRWVWAIVLRRGDEIRVVEGGSVTPTKGAPDPAIPALEWLIQRVDDAAK